MVHAAALGDVKNLCVYVFDQNQKGFSIASSDPDKPLNYFENVSAMITRP